MKNRNESADAAMEYRMSGPMSKINEQVDQGAFSVVMVLDSVQEKKLLDLGYDVEKAFRVSEFKISW